MSNYIEGLISYIENNYKTIIIVTIAVIALLTFLGGYVLPKLNDFITRKIKRLNKAQFKGLQALLAHKEIVETYAPSREYYGETDENKRHIQLSFYSPYRRALKATYKRNRVKNGQVFYGHKQIRAVKRQIKILPITQQQAKQYDPEFTYRLRLNLFGKAREEIAKLSGAIKSQLRAYQVTEIQDKNETGSITFLIEMKENQDPLIDMKISAQFYDEHPPIKNTKFPLAMTADKQIWVSPLQHTLIWGTTGSGKGSPIQGYIRQGAELRKKGLCKLYGIDPKAAEFKVFTQSSLFTKIGMNSYEQMTDVLLEVSDELYRRKEINTVDLDRGIAGRSLPITRENPIILLIIDELPSYLKLMKQQGRIGTTHKHKLMEILQQGRSLNIYFIGATQVFEKDLLEDIRAATGTKILLRTADGVYFNDLVLGDKAAENGYNSTAIPPANISNNYATAGIGFVKNETGEILKVRFPYISDKDLTDYLKINYPKNNINKRVTHTNINRNSLYKNENRANTNTTNIKDLFR